MIRRRFLWGGNSDAKKIHWVAWEKVVAPKKKGGLGVGSIQAINLGLLVKWWWRLKNQYNSLCRGVIYGIHKLENKPPDLLSSKIIRGVWNNIAEAKQMLSKYNLGFHDIFEQVTINKWRCKLEDDGRYSVAALRRSIEVNPNLPPSAAIKWRKEVPHKVLCFTWRAMLGRIPSNAALLHRGINVQSPRCSSCGTETEDADHLLVSCPLAKRIWDWVWDWCRLNAQSFSKLGDILEFISSWGSCPKRRKMLEVICHGVIWSLWIARNDWVFNKRHCTASKIMDDIISLIFMWFKHRGRLVTCNWASWCIFPFDCL